MSDARTSRRRRDRSGGRAGRPRGSLRRAAAGRLGRRRPQRPARAPAAARLRGSRASAGHPAAVLLAAGRRSGAAWRWPGRCRGGACCWCRTPSGWRGCSRSRWSTARSGSTGCWRSPDEYLRPPARSTTSRRDAAGVRRPHPVLRRRTTGRSTSPATRRARCSSSSGWCGSGSAATSSPRSSSWRRGQRSALRGAGDACGSSARRRSARSAAPFLVLAPAAVFLAVSADAMFAAVAAWGLAALACAATASGRRVVGWSVRRRAAARLVRDAVLRPAAAGHPGARRAARWRARGGRCRSPRWPALAVVLAFAALGFAWWEAYPVLVDRYWDGIASTRPAPTGCGATSARCWSRPGRCWAPGWRSPPAGRRRRADLACSPGRPRSRSWSPT